MKITDIQAAVYTGFLSLTLQTIHKDVTGHENNRISSYLSNPHSNYKVIITIKFPCTLLYLHETPCMGKKQLDGGSKENSNMFFSLAGWQMLLISAVSKIESG